MNEVHKPSDPECYIPSSESLGVFIYIEMKFLDLADVA
jgi:hypothetical protein